MQIEFDTEKSQSNQDKHRVPLGAAESIEWDTLWAKPDDRQDYGEERMIGYAYIGLRLYCVVYVDRAESRRIISLRKANSREVESYANA